jgi:hypothetical protein
VPLELFILAFAPCFGGFFRHCDMPFEKRGVVTASALTELTHSDVLRYSKSECLRLCTALLRAVAEGLRVSEFWAGASSAWGSVSTGGSRHKRIF